jgi:hypothetical protein
MVKCSSSGDLNRFFGTAFKSHLDAGLSVSVSSMAMRGGTSTHPVRGRFDLQSDTDRVGGEIANLILDRNLNGALPHVSGVMRHRPPFALFVKAAESHRKDSPGRIALQLVDPNRTDTKIASCRVSRWFCLWRHVRTSLFAKSDRFCLGAAANRIGVMKSEALRSTVEQVLPLLMSSRSASRGTRDA